ncbi:MAG: hypothetical protein HY319_04245 [Armatimonadetes bacterium]|nr:hypothetical protein [Armatimonadota bacterium]
MSDSPNGRSLLRAYQGVLAADIDIDEYGALMERVHVHATGALQRTEARSQRAWRSFSEEQREASNRLIDGLSSLLDGVEAMYRYLDSGDFEDVRGGFEVAREGFSMLKHAGRDLEQTVTS